MDHYQTETTLVLAKFGINDVNTYRFQMERSECEASIMGVPQLTYSLCTETSSKLSQDLCGLL